MPSGPLLLRFVEVKELVSARKVLLSWSVLVGQIQQILGVFTRYSIYDSESVLNPRVSICICSLSWLRSFLLDASETDCRYFSRKNSAVGCLAVGNVYVANIVKNINDKCLQLTAIMCVHE